MFEKIKEIIVRELGADESQVTMETSFKDDLGVDSLDLFQMVMAVEEEYDIEIPSEDIENISTVGEFVEYLKGKIDAE